MGDGRVHATTTAGWDIYYWPVVAARIVPALYALARAYCKMHNSDNGNGRKVVSRLPDSEKTPLEAAMEDVQAKTAAVAEAKVNIGVARERAAAQAKESINAAKVATERAKAALIESRKAFDRAVRAATK